MKVRTFVVSLTIAGTMFAGTALAQTPNTKAETQWQQFLAKHPNVQAGLVNDPGYLAQHPGMAKWLQKHPAVSAYARQQGQIGGWDKNNQWHQRSWWMQNNPAWVHEHHPEWMEQNAVEHHPQWVHQHHPGWYESEEHHAHDHWDHHHDRD